jgi:hypothetical protein
MLRCPPSGSLAFPGHPGPGPVKRFGERHLFLADAQLAASHFAKAFQVLLRVHVGDENRPVPRGLS